MFSPQHLVISWLEFAIASAILLAITKAILDRLQQPVDRVNLIATSLTVIPCALLLLGFLGTPCLHLGLVALSDAPSSNMTQANAVPPVANGARESDRSNAADLEFPSRASPSVTSDGLSQDEALAQSLDPSSSQPSINDAAQVAAQAQTTDDHANTRAVASTTSRVSAPTASAGRMAVGRMTVSWMMLATILILAHVLVAIGTACQWIMGSWRLQSMAKRAVAADQPVQEAWQLVSGRNNGAAVRLMISSEIRTPLVFGLQRPTILIPEAIASGDRSRLEFCLAHEWSHINGRDLLRWQWINLVQDLFWYQPVYWWLRRELRTCQDLIADDRAATIKSDELGRIEYSELLIALATAATAERHVGAMAIFDRSSELTRRVELLLAEKELRSRSTWTFRSVTAVVLLVLAVFVGSLSITSADAQQVTVGQAQKNDQPNESVSVEEPKPVALMKVVRGKVINAAGQGVPAAQLWWPVRRQPQQTLQATTDDAGNFEIKIADDVIGPRFIDNEWVIWAYARGYSIRTQSVYQLVHGRGEKECTLQLAPESQTAFDVLGADGKPLSDVLVQPLNYRTEVSYDLVPDEMRSVVSARTDKLGHVTLPAIESVPLFKIELSHADYGRQTMRVDGLERKEDRRIRLQPTASMKGKLVGEKREWLSKVKLAFATDNDEFEYTQGLVEIVTDEDGRFEVPKIASGGPLRSYVQLDSQLPVRPILPEGLFLVADETTELDIPLVTATNVRGKVLAKENGKPVAGAEIYLAYGGYHQAENVTTDANGIYQARCLPGNVRVQITSLPDNYVQLGEPWAEAIAVPDNVSEFELPTIEVVGTRKITGRLIGAKDLPLVGKQVLAIHANRRYGFGKSDQAGRFEMNVPVGVETRIEVYEESRGSLPVEEVQREPLIVRFTHDVLEKETEAQRSHKADVVLTGRVLMDGRPLPGVKLRLQRGTAVPGPSGEEAGMRYSQASETVTDANGAYRLTGLKPGDNYAVEVKSPFPATDPTWHYRLPYIRKLPDDAKGEVELPDMMLRKLTQSIAGVVVDPDGKPVKGATVTAMLRNGQSLARVDGASPPPWVETDKLGRFQLTMLPDEPLTLMAYFNNPQGGRIRFPAKVNVKVNQQNVRIILDPALQKEDLP